MRALGLFVVSPLLRHNVPYSLCDEAPCAFNRKIETTVPYRGVVMRRRDEIREDDRPRKYWRIDSKNQNTIMTIILVSMLWRLVQKPRRPVEPHAP